MARSLHEYLYYAVREDWNTHINPAWREPDERILPALDILATMKSPDGLCDVEIQAFIRAMVRRGREADLKRITWLKEA